MPASVQTSPRDHIPEDFSLDEMKAHLSEAELAALSEGDDPVFTVAEDGNMAVVDQIPDDTAAAEAAAVQNAAAAQAQAPAAAPAPEVKLQPVPDTSAATAAIQALDDQLNTLAERYDMGEIDRAEMLAEQKRIAAEQARAQFAIEQANQVIVQNAQATQKTWFDTLENWRAQNGADALWNEQNVAMWDATLKQVNGNSGYLQLSHERRIELAYDLFNANLKAQTGQTLQLTPKPAAKSTQGAPRTDERDAPQTLAGYNADTTATISDGTFAAIDRMMATDPIAAERMLARLPADQQEAYLNAV
jgi:hypothetical protein